jgi:hypothetical protein
LCESGLVENPFFHDDDDEQALVISHISTMDLPSAVFSLVPATSSGTGTSVGCHPSSHSMQITQKRYERYQPNVNQRSKCLVGSREGRDTVVFENPTRSDSLTAAVAIPLLLPIKLQPSSPACSMTTRHVQVRLVRVGAVIPPGKPQELDYQGHSISASVVVTGGDEISFSKAMVEQEGYQGEKH